MTCRIIWDNWDGLASLRDSLLPAHFVGGELYKSKILHPTTKIQNAPLAVLPTGLSGLVLPVRWEAAPADHYL